MSAMRIKRFAIVTNDETVRAIGRVYPVDLVGNPNLAAGFGSHRGPKKGLGLGGASSASSRFIPEDAAKSSDSSSTNSKSSSSSSASA